MKLIDYDAIRHHRHDIKEISDAILPSHSALWVIHMCNMSAMTTVAYTPILVVGMLMTMSVFLASTYCSISMMLGKSIFDIWYVIASWVSFIVFVAINEYGRNLYKRQVISFGYFWYLIGYTSYLSDCETELFDESELLKPEDKEAILDYYAESDYDIAQVMFDSGIYDAASYGDIKTPYEIIFILVNTDERYTEHKQEILKSLVKACSQVEGDFIIDYDKLDEARKHAYGKLSKEFENGMKE